MSDKTAKNLEELGFMAFIIINIFVWITNL